MDRAARRTRRDHVPRHERPSGGALLAADVRIPAGAARPRCTATRPAEVYRVERGELAIYTERAPAP